MGLVRAVVAAVLLPPLFFAPACGARTSLDLPSGGASGGASGSFPFGPSCSSITEPCWNCALGACPGLSCITTDCGAYYACACACASGDSDCAYRCLSKTTPSCLACQQQLDACAARCPSACSTSGFGDGGGGQSGCAGATGPGPSSSSSGASPGCTTCNGAPNACSDGQGFNLCLVYDGRGGCTAVYFAGGQSFVCASCTDTSGCSGEAQTACQ